MEKTTHGGGRRVRERDSAGWPSEAEDAEEPSWMYTAMGERAPSTDLVTFVSVSLVLAAVAAVASLIPALRATRVDPVEVLKEE
jgi:hypothetical protein